MITSKFLAILFAAMVLIIAAVSAVLYYTRGSVAQQQITYTRPLSETGSVQGHKAFDHAWKPSTTKAPPVQNPWPNKQ
ncbi:MAG: hypothetical protein ACREFN_03625 [Acetobacteraceae bacterium]